MAALALSLVLSRSHPPPPLDRANARFNAERALRDTAAFAEQYPNRVTGRPGAERAAQFLHAFFTGVGFRAWLDDSEMWLEGERVRVRNVVAFQPGDVDEQVVVMAHYDSQFTSREAAADNGTGVAVMMELARVLSNSAPEGGLPRRGLLFIATDAEEWGMIGARNFIQNAGLAREKMVAAISLDYVNHGAPAGVVVSAGGQGPGFAPMWLRSSLEAAVRAAGSRTVAGGAGWELVNRAIRVSFQDNGPFNTWDVPAVNLGILSTDLERERAIYHTPDDRADGIRAEALAVMGRAAELAARHAGSAPLERSDPDYFRMTAERYLPSPVSLLVAIVLFVPLFVAARGCTALPWGVLQRMAPLVAGYGALLLVTSFNLVPRYELYPATLKDPFLQRIPWAAVAAAAGGAFLAWLVVRLLAGRWHRSGDHSADRRPALTALVLIVLAALVVNRFAAVFFLWTAAVLWPLARTRWRTVNVMLVVGGALPFVALVVSFASLIYMGWRIPFYLLLQAAYGTWSGIAVLLFLATVATGIELAMASALAPVLTKQEAVANSQPRMVFRVAQSDQTSRE